MPRHDSPALTPEAWPGRSRRAALPWLLALLLVAGPGRSPAAETGELPEYQLKAAFLYNFAKFIQWPATNRATAAGPLVIGVLGVNPFGSALRDTVEGKRVNQRPIIVREVASPQEATNCQVLFVARSEMDRVPRILQALRGHPVLTVGDMAGFGQRGGMINLVLVGRNIRFEINIAETEAAGLKVSSKLGSLGLPVKTGAAPGEAPP